MATYANMVGQFVYKQPLLRDRFDQLAENDQYLKDNNWQDGVKVVFYQATVPTGWTQETSANDKWLRVVNNTGGNPGGATGGSIAVSAGITLAHVHSDFTAAPNHTHLMTDHQHRMSQNDAGTGGGSSINSPRGVGDVVVSNFTGSTSTNSNLAWTRFFDSTVLNQSASSSSGSHIHSVASSLTNTIPHYADVIIGIKSTSSGYTDLTNQFNHNDRIRYEPFAATGGLYGNDSFTQARLTPFGTVAMFYNPTSPTGWLKVVTVNNRGLRVVSGAGGGTAGNLPFSTTITLNHTHTVTTAGDHTHTIGTHRHNVAGSAVSGGNSASFFFIALDGSDYLRPTNNDGTSQTAVKGRTTLGGSGTSGGSGNHSHSLDSALTNINLAYVDVIQCQKLSTGAAFSFQDLTSTVQYKKLVTYQKLNKFAQNDEYIKYHVVPAGAVMAFYQSSIPFLWNLLSAQHDKVLRVVTGAGGGSGGSHLISNTIVLQHTHVIGSQSHAHLLAHTHTFDTNVQAAGSMTANSYLMQLASLSSSSLVSQGNIGTGTGRAIKNTSDSANALTDSVSHDHGGVTSSQFTNIVFAYANVILCQKT